MRVFRGTWLALCVTALLGSAGCGGGNAGRLDGAGSSFIDPMMQKWADEYKKEKNVNVNYQSKGSGAGINMMTGKEVEFGCSDAPLNDEQIAKCKEKGGDVVHLPLCMGAIVPAYNLEGITELVFDGPTLMNIYLGKVTRWNDPALVKLNPRQKLPDKKISVAYRSDSSGSTFILTDYFMKIDKDAWTPGKGTAIKFPVGTASKGNDGVAGFVKGAEGSIGYVELIYALNNKIAYGGMVNAKGKTIRADMKSVTEAAAAIKIPDDLRYSITNSPGEGSYPIAGTVWAIVYVKQPGAKAELLQKFLRWITHDGQTFLQELHYAPLPDAVVKKIESKLKQIEAAQ